MAIYHLDVNVFCRKDGHSCLAAAAYRAGALLTDDRDGQQHDYRAKKYSGNVVFNEVLLPGGGTMEASQLWNAVERHHKRADAITSREIEAALPHELDAQSRHLLAQKFAAEVVEKYGVAAQLSLHGPRPVTDAQLKRNPEIFFVEEGGKKHNGNWHFHLLMSACSADKNGKLGKKVNDLDAIHCQRNKVPNVTDWARQRWAELVNEALANAGISERVDHRSHLERGIDDEPQIHVGKHGSAVARSDGQHPRLRLNNSIKRRNRERESIDAEIIRVEGEIAAATAVAAEQSHAQLRMRLRAMHAQVQAEQQSIAKEAAQVGLLLHGDDAAKAAPIKPLRFKPWKSPSGEVVYLKEKRDERGKIAAFSESQDRVKMHMSDRDSMRAALLLAHQKWPDGITITGTPEFCESALKNAHELGISVLNAPQPKRRMRPS